MSILAYIAKQAGLFANQHGRAPNVVLLSFGQALRLGEELGLPKGSTPLNGVQAVLGMKPVVLSGLVAGPFEGPRVGLVGGRP